MFRPTAPPHEIYFIGLSLEGFFCGLYSGIFAMYLKHLASKKGINTTQNIIFYSMSALYLLSVATFVCDIAFSIGIYKNSPEPSLLFIQTTSFACCEFIGQFILIYRCWIVWGRNTRVVIIPSILSFAFLGTWLSYNCSATILSDRLATPRWAASVLPTTIALSLTVNALVTSLIVFRILKAFREVKSASEDKTLCITGGTKLRRTILVLIESGMVLFSVQLARVVVTIVWTDAATKAFNIIVAIHQMLNGITPTIILVRTSMGLSFHDETSSVEEASIGSFRLASNHPDSVPETGSIGIVGQDSGEDVQRSNDIER